MPYTSLNGHMFSFLDKTGAMALRLPKDRRDEFIATYETGLAEQHGRVVRRSSSCLTHFSKTPPASRGGST